MPCDPDSFGNVLLRGGGVMTAKDGFDALTHEQSKQMLEWFMHRVDPDQREELAATLPAAYNAWCGRQIVHVVSGIADNGTIDEPLRVWSSSRTELVDGRFVKRKVGLTGVLGQPRPIVGPPA